MRRASRALYAAAGMGLSGMATPGLTQDAPTAVAAVTVTGQRGYAAETFLLGGREPVSVLEVPNSVSVITRERIEDQNLITVEDALRETTGVNVTTWDGLVGQVRARGYSLDVSYDGIPTYSGSSGVQEFDLSVYERVEVLRGPAGIFKGSSQPGGTANFVRKRGLKSFAASAVASAGTWENYRGEVDLGGPLAWGGRLRGRVVASRQERDFYVDRAHQEKSVAYGALDFDITARTTANLSITWQEDAGQATSMGLPAYTDGRFISAPRSTNVSPDWNLTTYETVEYAADLSHRFGNGWRVRGRVGLREQDKSYTDAFPSPNVGVDPATGLIATYNRRSNVGAFTRNGVDLYASGPFSLFGRSHDLTVGYGWELYETRTRNVNAPVFRNVPFGRPNVVPRPDFVFTTGSNFRVEQSGVYTQARLDVADPLKVVVGARLSDFETRSRATAPSPASDWRPGARAEDEVTPYAGLVYYLQRDITAYASYSDIFMPQTAERAGGGPLDPRIGAQIEAGLKGRFRDGGLLASAAVFRTRERNRALPDVSNPGFFVQAGEVEVRGAELEVVGRPLEGLDLTLGYTYLKTEYLTHQSLEGQSASVFEPEHAFKGFAKFTPSRAPLPGLWVAAGVNANSTIVGGGVEGLREQEPVAIFSLHGGWRVTPRVTASVAVNNLFDETYYARVGGLNTYNTYGDPRNAVVSLRARF